MDKPRIDPTHGVPGFVKWGLFYPAIFAIVFTIIVSVIQILGGIFGWD